MAEVQQQGSPSCTLATVDRQDSEPDIEETLDSPLITTPEPSAFSRELASESEPSSRSNSVTSSGALALGRQSNVGNPADKSFDSGLLGASDVACDLVAAPASDGSASSDNQPTASVSSDLGHTQTTSTSERPDESSHHLRTPFNLANALDLSGLSPSAVNQLPPAFASANLDSDNTSGEVAFPAFTTPSKQAYPAYVNPLYDSLELPSPLTQPRSSFPRESAFVSGISTTATPTRQPGSAPLARRLARRRQHHDSRRLHQQQNATSDAARAAAVLGAALPLLYELAPRTRSSSGVRDPVSSLAALLGVAEATKRGASGHLDRDRPRSARLDDDAAVSAGMLEPYEDGDCGFHDDETVGTTLELMRRAAALQRQLAARSQEVAMLTIQNEELRSSREEMGLELLHFQEYVVKLESKLEHETRARLTAVAQSQLLQQQLQEVDEALHETQATAQSLRQQLRQQQQQAPGQTVDQVPGEAPSNPAGPLGRPPRAPVLAAPPPLLQSAGSAPEPGTSFTASSSLGGNTPWAFHPSFSGEDGDTSDPRDFELASLRRENQALTKRLIQTSLELAQAREELEEARHEVHLLHDLNQGAMQSVNTLSLELSLLRPNACGRARGRFSLPSFLRSSGGGGDSNVGSVNGSFSISAGGAMF